MKALRWFAINFGVLGAFILGQYLGNSGLIALSVAMFWLTAFIGIVLGFSEEAALKIYEGDPEKDWTSSVPIPFDIAYDIFVTVTLAFFGFPILAFFYFFHIIGAYQLRERLTGYKITKPKVTPKKPKEEKTEKPKTYVKD